MSLMNDLRAWFRRAILNEYDPTGYVRPASPSPTKAERKGAAQGLGEEYTVVGTNVYMNDPDLETPASASAESQVDMKLRLERGTKKELTELDILLLNEKNLNVGVAIHLKPYWIIGTGRKEASAILTRKFGENKGYSVSNIGAIYAILSASRKQELENQTVN